MYATRAAVEGIVPGGGVALIRAQCALDSLELPEEQRLGVRIVLCVRGTASSIAINAGVDGPVVVDKVKSGAAGFGFDAGTLTYRDARWASSIRQK